MSLRPALKRIFLFLACLSLLFVLTAAAADAPANPAGIDVKTVGVMTGTIHEDLAAEWFPDAKVEFFNDLSDLSIALRNGNIDAFTCDMLAARAILAEQPGLVYYPLPGEEQECGFAFSKSEHGRKLCAQMNEFLRKIREDGTMAELERKWMEPDGPFTPVDMTGLSKKGPKLTFVSGGSFQPITFILNGELAGLDLDIAVQFCREYGYGIDVQVMSFPAICAGITTGKYDFSGSAIIITPERQENMLFSDPEYVARIVMVVCSAETAEEEPGFLQSLGESFRKTFLREDRWKMIVRGVGTTALITVCAVLLGTILGFGVCLLRRSRNPLFSGFAKLYVRFLQGTPMVVLLMILFYVVFARTNLPGTLVAIIGFGLNFGAYVSEMLRSGLDAVDPGQTEAALAIGYTRAQTFTRIVLPQAARHFLPVYQGECVSLLKSTSIVGYIAVQDLTKMSDLIRSRTYEAFFPLIATAVIYFLIAWVLTTLLKRVEVCVLPRRNKRRVRGVQM